MKIGLFFGSSTCYTEMAAEKIRDQLGHDLVDLHNIKEVSLAKTADYEMLIFGISTWDYGELQEDWESHWSDIDDLSLNGKIVAIFGMGDQEGYGEWFLDAMGMLHDAIAPQAPEILGYWPNDDSYQFTGSKALTQDGKFFVGLALDDETQYELSDNRIATWCDQLLNELNALSAE
ncbi:flavodoxin FldB [Corallincola luteus]|uniref:Flavodoxin n=1 Tax=Corallincola luteus TaxID=1775177 RepID=A0ABY2APP2_9GAMM|nr:flavodoxin FldB [Corallincola luteus]TCI04982.1 flavodoxin FldB [Corallincola luteus]